MPMLAFGSYGPSVWSLVPGAVEHDEVHVGEHAARPPPCRRDGCATRSKFTSGRPLCAMNVFTPRSCAFWIDRQSDGGIFEREPVTVGTPCGVDLERGDLAGVARPPPSRRVARRVGPTLGAITLWTSTRGAPPCVSCAASCCVPSWSGTGTGASAGPEFGHVGEHRDGRVAREEHVVQVGGAVGAFELVRTRRTPGPCRAPAAPCRARSSSTVRRASRGGCARRRRTRCPTSACSHASTSRGGRHRVRAARTRRRRPRRRSGPRRGRPTSCTPRGRSWRARPRRHPQCAGTGAGRFPRRGPRRRRARGPPPRRRASCRVGGAGTYSPLVAGSTPSGSRTSPSGSSAPRGRVTRRTICGCAAARTAPSCRLAR